MKERAEYDELVWLLTLKYVEDTDTFREFLPGVADALDCVLSQPYPTRPAKTLSDLDRDFHQRALNEVMKDRTDGVMPSEQAVKALEHFAPLAQDVRWAALPYYDDRIMLLKSAVGRLPCSFWSRETVVIDGRGAPGKVAYSVPLLRGVNLELDRHWKLLCISVSPHVFRERSKIMDLFGMSHELKIDTALRHDDYLADIDPHGRC